MGSGGGRDVQNPTQIGICRWPCIDLFLQETQVQTVFLFARLGSYANQEMQTQNQIDVVGRVAMVFEELRRLMQCCEESYRGVWVYAKLSWCIVLRRWRVVMVLFIKRCDDFLHAIICLNKINCFHTLTTEKIRVRIWVAVIYPYPTTKREKPT